jgi:hypothetical protein
MPQRMWDRVQETTTTTGTGSITLVGAVAQYSAFSARFVTGASMQAAEPIYYAIIGQTGTEWEVGKGYLTGATTLVRDTVFTSSNADALVSFSAGTKNVFNTIPGERMEEIFTKGQTVAAIRGFNQV